MKRSGLARGALAGAVAAGTWAAQQPLDKRIFRCDYDDVELLGKLITRSGWWPLAGLAFHVANGAAFGMAYTAAQPRVPGSGWRGGLAVALAENFASWPLVALTDRLHPARDELPRLSGNRRALVQATWRHALFGALLGALAQRRRPG